MLRTSADGFYSAELHYKTDSGVSLVECEEGSLRQWPVVTMIHAFVGVV